MEGEYITSESEYEKTVHKLAKVSHKYSLVMQNWSVEQKGARTVESHREVDIFYKKLIDKYINKKRSLTHAIEMYEQFYQESLGEPSGDIPTTSTHGANGEPPRSMEARSVTSLHPVQLDTIASASITLMEHQQITTTSPAGGAWTVCPTASRQTSTLPTKLLRNRSA